MNGGRSFSAAAAAAVVDRHPRRRSGGDAADICGSEPSNKADDRLAGAIGCVCSCTQGAQGIGARHKRRRRAMRWRSPAAVCASCRLGLGESARAARRSASRGSSWSRRCASPQTPIGVESKCTRSQKYFGLVCVLAPGRTATRQQRCSRDEFSARPRRKLRSVLGHTARRKGGVHCVECTCEAS